MVAPRLEAGFVETPELGTDKEARCLLGCVVPAELASELKILEVLRLPDEPRHPHDSAR